MTGAGQDDVPPWPPEFEQRYRSEGYWLDRPLGHWMWRWADEYGDWTALVDGDRRISYRDLAETADALAARLLANGLVKGDRVVLQLPNTWEFVVVLLACLRAGVAPVLALMPHREHELDHLAALTEARAVFVVDSWRGFDHVELARALTGSPQVFVVGDDVPADCRDVRRLCEVEGDTRARRTALDELAPDAADLAFFLLSGGTTGTPKLIGRTHNDYEYCWRAIGRIVGVGPDSCYLAALPASHNFALGGPGVLGTLAAGGRVVLVPSPEPGRCFEVIAAEGVTFTSLVPAVALRWIEEAAARTPDLGSLRLVQIGGSVLDPAVARNVSKVLGVRLQQVFGMAEGLLNCTRPDDAEDVVFGTQGRPISPADEVRVVDADGLEVPAGEVGELLTRGPYTPRGYFRSPRSDLFTEDGWYRTGDLVRWHTSGNLVVEGRRKDLVNRGGEKVSADEVEALARELLGFSGVAVLPARDATFGEVVCLVVEGPEVDVESVRKAFLDRGVARYKIPEQVVAVDRLPLTPVGKVDKPALRRALPLHGGAI